ncbi:MAG: YfcE family phosphodiesterase [Clostridiales bacterium]|nr:YfcE family phosphodiesterase [Clostridiales bacterium]
MDESGLLYKMVVVSDTHHNIDNITKIIPVINSADYFVYCGDGVADIMMLRGSILVPIVMVKGNTDVESHLSDTATVTLGGTKALISHGDRYEVKKDLKKLFVAASLAHCKLVFFGHTHQYIDRKVQGIHFINPGSLYNGSYALVASNGAEFISKQHFVTELP